MLSRSWLPRLLCIGRDHRDNCGWPGWRRCRTTLTPVGCHGPKQSTWPRTDHSGDCWRPVALCTRSGASRIWWWWVVNSKWERLINDNCSHNFSLQCSDTVGLATGRASGPYKVGCWFVDGDYLTGVDVLQLQLLPPSPTSLASIKSRMETFWCWLTQVHLVNSH